MVSKKFWLVLLLLLHGFVLWKIDIIKLLLGQVQLWDFDIYYQTAVDVLHGAHPYQLPYMQTAGPPLVIAPYLLFSILPLSVARGFMTLVSLGAVFGTSWVVAKRIFPKSPLLPTLILNLILLCLFQPRFNILLGQPNLLLMFGVTVAVSTGTIHPSRKIGPILALITLFKTHYILVGLSLLRRSFAQALWAIVVGCFIFVITLPILKFQFYSDYVTQRLGLHTTEPLQISDVGYYNQSLRATTARLGIGSSFALLSLILLVGGGIYLYISGDIASGFLVSLLVSPIVWQHYMVLTYPILFITGLQLAQQRRFSWLFVAAVILLTAHLPWLHGKPVSLGLGILASHYYVGLLILLCTRAQVVHSCLIQFSTRRSIYTKKFNLHF